MGSLNLGAFASGGMWSAYKGAVAAAMSSGVGGGRYSSTSAAAVERPAVFTEAQWGELEVQALVFKYMTAGAAVPLELQTAVRRSYEARYYQQAAARYCTYYGKKVDPEPGRCRRTDGKKWRCSRDAHPDSKYCERHMHRGRNRSRKHVEPQSVSKSNPSSSSSTVTSITTETTGGSGSGSASLQSNQVNSMVGDSCRSSRNLQSMYQVGSTSSQLPIQHRAFGLNNNNDFRYMHGEKPEVDEPSHFSEASGIARDVGIDSFGTPWKLQHPRTTSSVPTRSGNGPPLVQYSYPHQVQIFQNLSQSSYPQPKHSFFGHELGEAEHVKQESQAPRPFFDKWPQARGSWRDMEDERCKRTSHSTTQLSISIPMASSDFSTTSSTSPNDD